MMCTPNNSLHTRLHRQHQILALAPSAAAINRRRLKTKKNISSLVWVAPPLQVVPRPIIPCCVWHSLCPFTLWRALCPLRCLSNMQTQFKNVSNFQSGLSAAVYEPLLRSCLHCWSCISILIESTFRVELFCLGVEMMPDLTPKSQCEQKGFVLQSKSYCFIPQMNKPSKTFIPTL